MNIPQLVEILRNKIKTLEERRNWAYGAGELDQLAQVETELSETRRALGQLVELPAVTPSAPPVEPPVEVNPLLTAEQYLHTVGFGGDRQPALIYLLLQLTGAGKASAKLNEAQVWLGGILFTFAADLQPRTAAEWGTPPHSYEDVVKDAAETLQS